MFKLLKEKLSSTLSVFTKKVDKEAESEETKEEAIKEPEVPDVKEKLEIIKGDQIRESVEESIISRIKKKVTTKRLSEEKFDELFFDLEMILLENNVAVEVIEKIKSDLRIDLVNQPLKKSNLNMIIQASLKKSIESLFQNNEFDLFKEINISEKPYTILFVGVNGSGKTTTIAKFVNLLQKNGLSSVIAASDTFRAAAIQQLEQLGKTLGVKVIKHDYGADPAAVAFDAKKFAKSKHIDVVLIDTAGRMHSNLNLTDEMKKMVRVAQPNLKIFVGEAITGNDAVMQSKAFNDAIDIDGIVLAKSDIDERGGAIISISYITGKPILYLGIGQSLDSLETFNKDKVIKTLGI